MNITINNIDALNAVVTVEVAKADYAEKVEKVLIDYRKKANISGFRKGAVPMSLIQKQHGKAVLLDEVNKLLQASMNNYLSQQKLNILGDPIPRANEDFNWNHEDFKFEFELGLAPQFALDLGTKNDLVLYKIVIDDIAVNEQIARIQKQYGKIIAKDTVAENDDVSGFFTNLEKGINNRTTLSLDVFADKKTAESFIGKKVGDVLTLNTKGLFEDEHKLMDFLAISHDDVHNLEVEVTFTIDEVIGHEPAALDQELFNRLSGLKDITSVEELKTTIKDDAEIQFGQQANQKFLNDVFDSLIATTTFDLPAVFLKKWIQNTAANPMSQEEAETEYGKAEKSLRYQLIETKLRAENNLQITFEELKDFTSSVIKKQMAQFGQTNPTDADVQSIVARVMSNKEEAKHLSEQVMSEKLLNLFKDKVKATTKEVSYDDFIKAMYGELKH